MAVTLSPQLEELVRRKVESGRYHSAGHVLEGALRLLDERDRWATLQAELHLGFDQLDRGEGVVWTPELMERLKQEASENARLGKPVKDAVKP